MPDETILFGGLDGEMTGSDIGRWGTRLIQIGAALEDGGTYTADIGWRDGEYTWSEQALQVNGFTHARIQAGRSPAEVDEELAAWLIARGVGPRSLVPVGFNVGTFDMPFVRATLPDTARLFSYRACDLNTLCFGLHRATIPTRATRTKPGATPPTWKGWKRMAKRAAEESLTARGIMPAWHDAGYDALAALEAYHYLQGVIAARSRAGYLFDAE